jgi:hypothetical protein
MLASPGLLIFGFVLTNSIHISSPPLLSFVAHLLALVIPSALGGTLFADGVNAVRNARMDRAPAASDVLARDSRAPVLYLRSFKQDAAAAHLDPMGYSSRSDEEQMSEVLRRIGPVVAVGNPSERRVTLGANRIYLRDDEWQDWVKSRMRAAALVMFRASDTDAFWWEVATAALHVPRQRIAFLLPDDARVYEEFRQRLAKHFTDPLPPILPALSSKGMHPTGLWGLMYFNDAGRPVFRRRWGDEWTSPTPGGIVDLVGLFSLGLRLSRTYEPEYLYLFRPLLKRAGAPTLRRPTVFGVFTTFSFVLFIVPFQILRLILRRIQGKGTVTLLPGWNESG